MYDRLGILVPAHLAGKVAACIMISILVLFLTLREIFKPVGKRDAGARLPSGPNGIPIFGNLLSFGQKHGQELAAYVSNAHLGAGSTDKDKSSHHCQQSMRR